MPFFAGECLASVAASLTLLALLYFSGAVFARLFDVPGGDVHGARLLCGLAVLPVLLDLAGRFGPRPMAALALLLAAAGAGIVARGRPALSRKNLAGAAAAAAWLALCALAIVDWPDGEGARHSLVVLDYAKHASATWAIADAGTPPFNPAAFEPGRPAAYYYFFYTLTAVVALVGGPFGLLPRHAAFGAAGAMGVVLFAAVLLVWRFAGFGAAPGDGRRRAILAGALLLTTGLDVLPTAFLAAIHEGRVLQNPEHWNEQVTSWLSSLIWVPHHVAALCAAWVGFLALAADDAQPGWRRVALAGVAFASMAGLSIHVAIGGVLTAALWALWSLCAGRGALALRIAAAGAASLLLAAPWLATLASRMGSGPAPVASGVRGFLIAHQFTPPAWRTTVDLVAMPLSYALEFGVFALGAALFWRRMGRAGLATETGRVLLVSTVAAVAVGSFLGSTVHNNDLGWRVMLFAQFSTLIWTADVLLRPGALAPSQRRLAAVAAGLGYLFIAHSLLLMRVNDLQTDQQVALAPQEREGWEWLGRRLPPGAIVQERPDVLRVTGYALYGRFPTALADAENALLYGAPRAEIDRRMRVLAPIFVDPSLDAAQVAAGASREHVDALVVSAADPVFADPASWVHRARPDFANAGVKIFLMPRTTAWLKP